MRSTPFALTPWVRGILAANAAVFLLQLTVFTGPWFGQTFAFDPHAIGGHWWSFGTHMFVHGGFLQFALAMLMLFLFGPSVEDRMGGRWFALYYLLCGLGGALLSVALSLVMGVEPLTGAAAAVFGVSLAFAYHWPEYPFYIFPIPAPIRAKWLVVGLTTLGLMAAIWSSSDGVAQFAHLGGLLVGFVYLRSEESLRARARAVFEPRVPAHVVPRTRRRAPVPEEEAPAPAVAPPETHIQDALDRVLDKISQSGIDSLTPDERRLLDDMSRQLRDE